MTVSAALETVTIRRLAARSNHPVHLHERRLQAGGGRRSQGPKCLLCPRNRPQKKWFVNPASTYRSCCLDNNTVQLP